MKKYAGVSAEGSGRAVPQRGSRWRTAFFALAGVGIVAGVAWALLGSRLFVVRSVAVSGTRLVPKSEVTDVADVPLGTSLAQVDPAAVARRVESIRQVASATVSKSWPDGLMITVRERVPAVAVRMAGGGYDLVDPSGVIVRWARAKPAALPLYATSVPGDALPGDRSLTAAAAVLGELPPWLSKSVASVTASGPVTLRLRDGKTVVWGGTDRAAVKARELAILMRDPARYLDVSAPGTAITRLAEHKVMRAMRSP
jgi:cell division protein FtsQ